MNNYREQYKRLLIEYERLGGNLQGVPRFYSLENEAKLRREMSKLSNLPMSQLAPEPPKGDNPKIDKSANQKIDKLISDYPQALHPVYLAKKNHWLQACSLKLQLNALPAHQESQARTLQQQLWHLFEEMDACDTVLDHWTKYKRILLPTAPSQEEALDKLSPTQQVQRLHTLRSNIVSREKSLIKWRLQAAESEGENFTLIEKIFRKTEELKQLKLLVKTIEKKINVK
ncbi:hypothetical protein JMN10_12800 [Capnocytophaga genosp. AHN8471]|uniref:Uncharacterized protein n=1 Tax=Capnocytophaga genosp. AHN8471 TaxID=327574 RepID=A0ABS1YTE8_9FLAO|nr:hypothetical protein [Capnocytophaga genosp. AHN8471]MBM0649662.1 hypothetical protein [Capnocytophaga genosp. AHN8471]MBM0663049.1 hypothetical protein [Capnocytophaga genosp. AHN8471]